MRLYKINNLFALSNEECHMFKKYGNDWQNISAHEYLSEFFIEKYKDKIHWALISKYQRLSEATIYDLGSSLFRIFYRKTQKGSRLVPDFSIPKAFVSI